MELRVKTEEHLRVVQVATVAHGLSHRLQQALVHLNFMNFELHVSQSLDYELELFLQVLK